MGVLIRETITALLFMSCVFSAGMVGATDSGRARDFGITPGHLPTGKWNAITDVAGVLVGHVTLIDQSRNMYTGVTAIVPHDGDLYRDRVPAGYFQGNGYGKMTGVTQLVELGEIETPVLLTNTNSVFDVTKAAIEWSWQYNPDERGGAQTRNPIVGETNDGRINDIKAFHVKKEHVIEAIEKAKTGPVEEGNVGAGAGTIAFGYKAGTGTSSRQVMVEGRTYTVGVLVQANYGGDLHILGVPVGRLLSKKEKADSKHDGSVMIIVATDAPLSDRNLNRLAKRAVLGIGRTGGNMHSSSGDYVISFSTSELVRRTASRRNERSVVTELPNNLITPLFNAVIEATEEAVYNALFAAKSVMTHRFDASYRTLPKGESYEVHRLPVSSVMEILRQHNLVPLTRK